MSNGDNESKEHIPKNNLFVSIIIGAILATISFLIGRNLKGSDDKVETWEKIFTNSRLFAPVIFFCIVIVAIGAVIDAVEKIYSVLFRLLNFIEEVLF